MTREAISKIAEGLTAGTLIPFLGPEVLTIDGPCPVPTSTRGLVERLTAKVAVPGRIRNNLWSAAQYIESNRHRQTLNKLVQEIFSPQVEPGMLHQWLASLNLPLIVDSWYDDTMARALEGKTGWGQALNIPRSSEWRDIWVKYFDPEGNDVGEEKAAGWSTMLYKPHGAAKVEDNYLLSDSDYVEVLTEIDIQTPIPTRVKELRTTRGFVFFGCRFYDQMERTFARQIIKRSDGPRYAVLPGDLTKNEERFLDEQNIERLDLPLAGAVQLIVREAAAALL